MMTATPASHVSHWAIFATKGHLRAAAARMGSVGLLYASFFLIEWLRQLPGPNQPFGGVLAGLVCGMLVLARIWQVGAGRDFLDFTVAEFGFWLAYFIAYKTKSAYYLDLQAAWPIFATFMIALACLRALWPATSGLTTANAEWPPVGLAGIATLLLRRATLPPGKHTVLVYLIIANLALWAPYYSNPALKIHLLLLAITGFGLFFKYFDVAIAEGEELVGELAETKETLHTVAAQNGQLASALETVATEKTVLTEELAAAEAAKGVLARTLNTTEEERDEFEDEVWQLKMAHELIEQFSPAQIVLLYKFTQLSPEHQLAFEKTIIRLHADQAAAHAAKAAAAAAEANQPHLRLVKDHPVVDDQPPDPAR